VTNQNEENQLYLLKYGDGMLIDTLIKLYRHCDSEIPLYPVTNLADKVSAGAVIREVVLATLKVLINLTHDFNNECKYKVLRCDECCYMWRLKSHTTDIIIDMIMVGTFWHLIYFCAYAIYHA
jgi:hypothetical protein